MEPPPPHEAEPSEMDRQMKLKLVRQVLETWQEDQRRTYRRTVVAPALAGFSLVMAAWVSALAAVGSLLGWAAALLGLVVPSVGISDRREWMIAAAVGLPFVALCSYALYVVFATVRRLRT